MATEGSAAFLHIILTLGVLLFASKLFAELFHRMKMPVVLGELLAGIIVGPFALGAQPFFDGKSLVVLDETVRHIYLCYCYSVYSRTRNHSQRIYERWRFSSCIFYIWL